MRTSGHMHINIPYQNAKNKNAACSKTAGLGTIACIVNVKVMSYTSLSRLILTNVCLRGVPHLACAHFIAMSFNESTALGLAAFRCAIVNTRVVGGYKRLRATKE